MIFPVWDWRKLPGTTCIQGDEPPRARNGARGESAFAGGCSDGMYGFAAMGFKRDSLTARKAWLFNDKGYVCLGAGIAAPTEETVHTSVNQCLGVSDVVAGGPDGTARTVEGSAELQGPAWVWQDDVVYSVPSEQTLVVSNAVQHGSWYSINHTYDKEDAAAAVFSLGISHGSAVRDGTYEYHVIPGTGLAEAPAAQLKARTLSNTPALQAVHSDDAGLTQIAFYEAGRIDVPDIGTVEVDKPCLLQVRSTGNQMVVAASNPVNEPMLLQVAARSRVRGEGCTWDGQAGITRLEIQLPEGQMAGSSVVRTLTRGR